MPWWARTGTPWTRPVACSASCIAVVVWLKLVKSRTWRPLTNEKEFYRKGNSVKSLGPFSDPQARKRHININFVWSSCAWDDPRDKPSVSQGQTPGCPWEKPWFSNGGRKSLCVQVFVPYHGGQISILHNLLFRINLSDYVIALHIAELVRIISGESNRPLTPMFSKSIAIHLPFLSRYFCLFGGRRKPKKATDFRRKPTILAENRRKPQMGSVTSGPLPSARP